MDRITEEDSGHYTKPPQRWNTGLLQYEVDLSQDEDASPVPRRRPLLAWLMIALLVLPLLVLLVLLVLR